MTGDCKAYKDVEMVKFRKKKKNKIAGKTGDLTSEESYALFYFVP